MKRFFPELSSCFSGTPVVQNIADDAPSRRRRMTQRRSRKHWRPALAAIAEDGAVREVRNQSAESAAGFRSEKNPLIKSKLAGKIRSDSYDSDYRKSTHSFELPAFSPTPFVF
ncbi:hypothetical protein L1987_58166 [Smallanthus sonchifolius]|uniref:Uncharacterized protein n=1 Tax=Smallanthus sonchifolius TaxID=185202 RepID=A0ACB9DEX7_9ASTR|nr:hypothetical protein L1987_58166 [Smallanthus sonchifolius]